ncbi:hypothetical protein M8C21_020140, partial [Ambrosia artemisiifolia]
MVQKFHIAAPPKLVRILMLVLSVKILEVFDFINSHPQKHESSPTVNKYTVFSYRDCSAPRHHRRRYPRHHHRPCLLTSFFLLAYPGDWLFRMKPNRLIESVNHSLRFDFKVWKCSYNIYCCGFVDARKFIIHMDQRKHSHLMVSEKNKVNWIEKKMVQVTGKKSYARVYEELKA